jgi:hypothetical protein
LVLVQAAVAEQVEITYLTPSKVKMENLVFLDSTLLLVAGVVTLD